MACAISESSRIGLAVIQHATAGLKGLVLRNLVAAQPKVGTFAPCRHPQDLERRTGSINHPACMMQTFRPH